MDDKIPWGPVPSCRPQSNRMRLMTQQKGPGTGPREEEMTRSIGSVMSTGALNCRPGLLRSKVAHILQQMVVSCNHRRGGPTSQMLAETGRGRREGVGRKGESQIAHEYCQEVKENMLISHGSGGGDRCLSQTRERLKCSFTLSLGNKWFSISHRVWVWISLGLQLRLMSLHRLLKWTYQPCLQKGGCLRLALTPHPAQPGRWWKPTLFRDRVTVGMHAGFPTHVASAPKQGGFQPFCLRCVVWGFNGWAWKLGRTGD